MLIGRAAECAGIDRLLEGARAGRAGVLVLRGDAGIGKTALLDYAAEHAEGMIVVRAAGVESEAELEFSGLLEIARPLLDHLAEVPERQAAALRSALGVGPAEEHDRFAIGAAVLGLLAAAAETAPLLLLADDAQWLDAPSTDAILFAARRLEADPIAVLVAARDSEGNRLEDHGIPSTQLAGLSREDGERLLTSAISHPIAPSVVDALCRETQGNPLALIEVPAALSDSQLEGTEALPDPLPVGSLVERALIRPADRLSEDSRRALLVAALSTSGALEGIGRALASLGLAPEALEDAEDAGFLRLEGHTVEFRHSLVRSAVSHAAVPSERRAAHRALAAAETGERRAWHLAAAALGPDEEAASALAAVAEQARERSGYAAAAAALERAARLSPGDVERSHRLYRAAEAHFLAGRSERALTLVDEALARLPGDRERARMLHLRGRLASLHGELPEGVRDLLDAVAIIEDMEPENAVAILADAVESLEFVGDVEEVLRLAERARRLAPDDGGTADLLGSAVVAEALAQHGAPAKAAWHADRILRIVAENETISGSTRLLYRTALSLAWCDRVSETVELAEHCTALARERGEIATLAHGLEIVAWMQGRSGRWREARATATEGLGLASETGQRVTESLHLIHLARAAAVRGNESECRANAEEALSIASAHGLRIMSWWAECDMGMLELGLGKLEQAAARLEHVADEIEQLGYFDRDISPQSDLVEAYVRLGRVDDARRALARCLAYAPRTSLNWGPRVALRSRALVAGDDDFESLFREAIAGHGTLDPFDLARTRLCFGERLRRTGRRREARTELREALAAFENLGAEPWAERCRTELRASGETLRCHDPTNGVWELTPQEFQIALRVAEGKTNKEVGAALFLSHKTIEFHLHRIYRKLDIASRAELIRLFASGAALAGG